MADSTSKQSKSKVSFADLFEKSQAKIPSIRRGQEVKGKVVAISKEEILIDIGAKSEGIVSGRELDSVKDIASKLSVGDSVEVTIVQVENDAGQVVLSLRKLSGEKRWQELEEKRDNDEDINVVALEANRGGVICDYIGLRGFLPASQLLSAPSKLSDLIGKTLSVRVIEVDRASNRLIFSQKTPDRGDISQKLELLSKIDIGEKMKGVITAVLPFGVFVEVDLGKVSKVENVSTGRNAEVSEASKGTKLEGLVHISELSWEKTEDPSKLFKVGEKVEVLVIAKDEESGRLNLSIKQTTEDPFAVLSKEYTKDSQIKGSVLRVSPYGVYISLKNGLEGLIHISKIPPEVTYEVGQAVECSVDGVDNKSRNIILVPVVKQKPILYR